MKRLPLSECNTGVAVVHLGKELKQGAIIVVPTDTVYGLLADATNEQAIDRVLCIKQRDKEKALPIFVKDITMAKKYAVIREREKAFLEEVWPGATTVVLKRGTQPLPQVVYQNDTVGLRAPDHEFVQMLLRTANVPLVGTSANLAGKPASTKIADVIAQFAEQKDQPDIIINAGDLPASQPSKVIDITTRKPRVIRE